MTENDSDITEPKADTNTVPETGVETTAVSETAAVTETETDRETIPEIDRETIPESTPPEGASTTETESETESATVAVSVTVAESVPGPPRLPQHDLKGRQKRFLKQRAHSLEPLVLIGQGGLGPGVYGAVSEALERHELIKIRVQPSASIHRKEAAADLPGKTGSHLVGQIGRVVILYRQRPQKPTIKLPKK